MKAIWNGKVIADSNDIVNVEGNSYFPFESVSKNYLKESDTHTVCHWKGTATYYNLEVEGKTNPDAVLVLSQPMCIGQKHKRPGRLLERCSDHKGLIYYS